MKALRNSDGGNGNGGGFPAPDQWNPAEPVNHGAVGDPGVTITPSSGRCFHDNVIHLFMAAVKKGFKGTFKWVYGAHEFTSASGIVAVTPDFLNKPGFITVTFTPDNGGPPSSATIALTYCALAGGGTGGGLGAAEYGSDGVRVGICAYTHTCAPKWCHACGTRYWCLHHDEGSHVWSDTGRCRVCGEPSYKFSGDSHIDHYPCMTMYILSGLGFPPGDGILDAKTRYHRGYPGDDATIYPVPADGPGCCPCAAHANGRITEGHLVSASGVTYLRDTTYGLGFVTLQPIAPGFYIYPDQPVYIKGTGKSTVPWDKMGVFAWKECGEDRVMTNNVTVFSVRVTPDDGTGQYSDNLHAVKRALPPEGMLVAAAPGTLTPFWIHDDVDLTGDYTLTLACAPGAFRVFTSNSTNGTPLLTAGQTVTNGMPVSFVAPAAAKLWLEAVSNGTATVTFSFEGTNNAAGFKHADALNITTAGVHISMKNDYSYLPFSPVFNGTTGKKWVVATFPEPQQTNIVWDVRLAGKTLGTARLLYQRGAGAETEIPWGNGGPHTLQFTNGWLNASVRLNDGSESVPTMTLASGVVTVSGVQQGDKIIAEETGSNFRDEIAVVKNFSWNDLQRLGPGNLTMHPDFNGLLPEIKDAIIGTILFCLDTSPGRVQKMQFERDHFYDSGSWGISHTDFRSNHPNLLTLEIPSARSVGFYPHDLDHFHIALETYPLPPSILVQTNALGEAWETVDKQPFPIMHAALRQHFVDLLNSAYGFPNNTPFLLFHTYEARETFSPAYMASGATAYLLPGDPVRNIRWTFVDPQFCPELTYPGNEMDASAWQGKSSSPQQVWQIGFFVDRKGRVVLVPQGGTRTSKGMQSDALREE